MSKTLPNEILRFSRLQRIEHLAVMLGFIALLVTGLPQKWPALNASVSIVDLFGGIHALRWLHRAAGVAFLLLAVEHLGRLVIGLLRGRIRATMFFEVKDFADAIGVLRHALGLRPSEPRFGRFDFRQKFEYWGLVFGAVVMVGTGLVLLFPFQVATWLPAQLIPAAKEMHSNEALLALLTILIWHLYGAHLSPQVFPFDRSMVTGTISLERMREEHPIELVERFGEDALIDRPLSDEAEPPTEEDFETRDRT